MQRQISKFCPWLVLVLAAALGCGGKSQVRAGERENEAGSHFGGSPGAGGSGAAGNGGTAPLDKCSLPPSELRSCDGSPFFFYNVHTGQCVPVDGMRCPDDYEGTFASLAECLATCPSAQPAADACDTASDCIVAQPGCCGGCEPIEASQLRAVHQLRRDVLGNDCDVACGACPEVTELQRTSQYFVPSCDDGQCVVTDLRRTTATECDADDDCTLRDGSACCEGCDGAGLVALSSAETITATCSDDLACDACAPPIPGIFEAGCDASGRCVVRQKPNGLIRGDAATCPEVGSSVGNGICERPPTTDCTYLGGRIGTTTTDNPMTCYCDESVPGNLRWTCVETDAEGYTDCPRGYPSPYWCGLNGALECSYGIGISTRTCACKPNSFGESEYTCTD